MSRPVRITAGISALLALGVLLFSRGSWASGVYGWLTTPISGETEHHIGENARWHGRLMVLAWAFLMPAAVVIARYFKITPRQAWPTNLDNPFWFVTHRRLGHAVAIVMTVALGFALWDHPTTITPWRSTHASLGWLLVILSWMQVIGSYLRGTHGGPVDPFTRKPKPAEEWPGDHFSMTRRRIVFEYVHKSLGYLIIVLAAGAILTGLGKADALRWMWLGLGLWWLACAVAVVVLQRRIHCIDTYQAIWGLDRALPGYRRQPIGIGIRRFTAADAALAPWQRRAPIPKTEKG